jgi:DNA polymerase III subunit gamma/tau
MSYQVIARKWRPQTFEDVAGQEPITRTLRNAIEHGRLHHAYLFSGARGVGKTTTARLLAKALNCHRSGRPSSTACTANDENACASCREIAESRSIDVLEIDAASNTGVDNVRDAIIGSLAIAPARDRYKIFIIDEVHMLSTAAFNALLKTLEEPPPHVVFIMATTERHKVPETVLSRSQQFEFRTIAGSKILERLRLIADAEKISIPEEALREIARAGEGSMRDAQSAFDQVISFAGTKITKEDVEMALGIAGAEILTRVIKAIANNKPAEALAVIDELVMRGHDLRNFCRDLMAHLRDLLVTKVSDSSELLESAICDREELEREAAVFSESDLIRFFHSLADTETKLRTATHPRYQLEVGLAKLIEMRRLEPLNQLMERLTVLEETLRTGKPPSQSKTPSSTTGGPQGEAGRSTTGTSTAKAMSASFAAAAAPALDQRAQSEPESPHVDMIRGATPTTSADELGVAPATLQDSEIERIKSALENRRKMFLVTALEGTSYAAIEANELHLKFPQSARHLRDTLAKKDNVKILCDVCRELTGREIRVRIVVTDPETNPETNDGAPSSREEEERREKQRLLETAEQNPVVQQMLRTFRGEILDVRRLDRET